MLTPLPANLEILHDRDALIIRRKWFSVFAFFLALFTLIWNGFMVVWMTIALKNGAWPMAAFGSIHAMVGIFLAYFCVASFVNKTDISIDPNYLKVRHYPLPWRGAKKLRVHEIQQLYCKEHIHRSKNGMNISYHLLAITNNRREQKLLSGLQEASQAQFIEREIENILGLKDIPVAGEHRK
ncbi:hypothetical protein QEH59_02405 [Coraliomargarita sp. SDUM461004]|uniref:Uncharacterized protein n=1 Tax=Thalassobacterium sedimentorum TaxID=3041258 RepID=A0ABU1AF08_9BACT|nr:hypothetical protein [Coraliomargarita sp. SDUM461004]MDQ8193259.1 hypothetical protein [Coraliomargarita sp. SDUM461004]